jgi:hypothetical protein
MVEGPMVRKYQMGAGTNLYAFRRNADALGHQPISFFKERFRVDHHSVAQHAGLVAMNNSGRQ